MTAPIALYPDSLLAQVLTASTYPLEIVQAARRWEDDLKLALTEAVGEERERALMRYGGHIAAANRADGEGAAFSVALLTEPQAPNAASTRDGRPGGL